LLGSVFDVRDRDLRSQISIASCSGGQSGELSIDDEDGAGALTASEPVERVVDRLERLDRRYDAGESTNAVKGASENS